MRYHIFQFYIYRMISGLMMLFDSWPAIIDRASFSRLPGSGAYLHDALYGVKHAMLA